jgi:hypothetical protein
MEEASARGRLERWAKWSGLTDAEIARRLKCDPSLPGKLRNGQRQPGLKVAHAIRELTASSRDDGARWKEPPIQFEEWLEPEVAPRRARRRSRRAAA